MKRFLLVTGIVLISGLLSACSEVNNLEKLGYSEAEAKKMAEKDYAVSIVTNKISPSDLSLIKQQSGYKEDNLPGYVKLYNKSYTKDEIDRLIIGYNAYQQSNPADAVKKAAREVLDQALVPVISLEKDQLTASKPDKGKDALKNILEVKSYFDGDITSKADITGDFSTDKPGKYEAVVKAKDSKGYSAEQKLSFTIADNEAPVISIPKSADVFTGDSFDPLAGVTAADNFDGDLTKSIIVDKGDFTTAKEGAYTLTYRAKDAGGNEGSATRSVTVLPLKNVGETFEVNKYEMTFNSFTFNRTDSEPASVLYQYYTAKDGNTFVITSLQIKNLDTIKRSPFEIFGDDDHKIKALLVYDGKYTYEEAPHGLDNNWFDTFRSIDPLVSETHNLSFEVPQDVRDSGKSLVLKISPANRGDTAIYVRLR